MMVTNEIPQKRRSPPPPILCMRYVVCGSRVDLFSEDVEKVLLALVDLVQDLLVVLLHQRLGHGVLLGEEAVEVAGFPDQLPLDVVDHARDYICLVSA